MRFGIDLRFYRPEPYGLANYIAGLWPHLISLLANDSHITKIVLFIDSSNSDKNLDLTLKGFTKLHPKFEIIYTDSKYYTLAEQTTFLRLVNSYKLDLMYFFTANFPLLYNRPFLYQIFDFTHQHQARHTNSLSYKLKARIFLSIIRQGVNKAKHILYLGNQAQKEAETFTKYNFTDLKSLCFKPNTVLQAGVSNDYLNLAQTNPDRFTITHNLPQSTPKQTDQATKWRLSLGVKGPYAMFVSVWKNHKNLTRMVTAFSQFHNLNPDFQLLICGRIDPNNIQEINQLKSHRLSQNGTILCLENLTNTEIIQLLDHAEFLIHPSLNEGFGMSLIEAASRGCPVICSDIPIFKSIMGEAGVFFDPYDIAQMSQTMQQITSPNTRDTLQTQAYNMSLDFRWNKVAKDIYDTIAKVTNTL